MSENFKLGEVVLNVQDLAKMTSFYSDVIGLVKLNETERSAAFGAKKDGEVLLVLEELKNGKTPSSPRTGLFHIAFLLPSREALGDMLIHLVKSKYPLDGAGDHVYSEALYLSDPEGNGIELYRDRPFEDWRVTEDGKYPAVTEEVDIDAIIDAASRAPFQKIHPETKMGHIHLQARDMDKTEDFYSGILGLNVPTKMPTARFFADGAYHHHIGSNNWAGSSLSERLPDETGLAYFTILTAHFSEWKRTLNVKGILMDESSSSLKLKDPNGIFIEIREIS
jgi:catechol 2,3-dioxygenase